MIASISGRIVRKSEDFLILEQGGIGFHIDIAPGMIASMPPVGETVTVHTCLHVRENEMGLFGFCTEEEKNLFTLVQTVSGVGPKLALQVVDALSPDAFALAILQSDTARLTQVKGIGKKSAARMILELTDKLKKSGLKMAEFSATQQEEGLRHDVAGDIMGETLAALMVLGYSNAEAIDALRRAGTEENDTVESLLRRALGQLAVI